MSAFLTVIAVILLLNLLLGVMRVARSTNGLDQVSACQLAGTLAAGILMVLSELQQEVTLNLVALALALPGAMTVVALRRVGWRSTQRQQSNPHETEVNGASASARINRGQA